MTARDKILWHLERGTGPTAYTLTCFIDYMDPWSHEVTLRLVENGIELERYRFVPDADPDSRRRPFQTAEILRLDYVTREGIRTRCAPAPGRQAPLVHPTSRATPDTDADDER